MEVRGNIFEGLVFQRAHANDGTVLFGHLTDRATHTRVFFAVADFAAGGSCPGGKPLLDVADQVGIIEAELRGYFSFGARVVALQVSSVVLQDTEDPGQKVLA